MRLPQLSRKSHVQFQAVPPCAIHTRIQIFSSLSEQGTTWTSLLQSSASGTPVQTPSLVKSNSIQACRSLTSTSKVTGFSLSSKTVSNCSTSKSDLNKTRLLQMLRLRSILQKPVRLLSIKSSMKPQSASLSLILRRKVRLTCNTMTQTTTTSSRRR